MRLGKFSDFMKRLWPELPTSEVVRFWLIYECIKKVDKDDDVQISEE